MATQTRERDLVNETNQGVIQATKSHQDVKEGRLAEQTVYLPSTGENPCQAIPDQRDGSPGSRRMTKMLGRLAIQLAVVHAVLAAPPATERGRISNAMVRAKHDRFISFLR